MPIQARDFIPYSTHWGWGTFCASTALSHLANGWDPRHASLDESGEATVTVRRPGSYELSWQVTIQPNNRAFHRTFPDPRGPVHVRGLEGGDVITLSFPHEEIQKAIDNLERKE